MSPRLLITLLCLAGSARADEPAKPESRTRRDVAGWAVFVDDRLLKPGLEGAAAKALGLMEGQLRWIDAVLPADKVKRLKQVKIFLDLTHGKLVSPQYHPSAGWLKGNGYAEELAKAVHVPSAAYFAARGMQREQPAAMLHELAHAFHDQVLGFDNAEVKAEWQRVVKAKTFDEVLHVNGRKAKHYALTNPMEFFAEMSESYWGGNDFFPFNAGELRQAEPGVFGLMEKVWGKGP